MATAAISLKGLSKRYGNLTAVANLNLEVEEGEILGFLGLNGAGKTTTIRILLDLLRPSGGSASVFGHDSQKHGMEARAKIGYLPSEMGVYPQLTGREVLNLLGGLNGEPVRSNYQAELMERLELPERDLGRRLREYSTGMKRKLGIIQALQGDPPLLILDEPTEGLDPLMQEAFHQLLLDIQKRGRTVFFSSHVLSQVDRVCQRVALMRKGELVLLANVEECRRLAPRQVRITFLQDVVVPEQWAQGRPTQINPRAWQVDVQGPMGDLLRALSPLPVADIEVSEARLEDVVLQLYRGNRA